MYMIRSFISSGAEVQNIPNIAPKRDEGDVKLLGFKSSLY